MGMREELIKIKEMIDGYLDGTAPMPRACIFTSITECRHGDFAHDDYEHALVYDEELPDGLADFDRLVDYTLGAAENYHNHETPSP